MRCARFLLAMLTWLAPQLARAGGPLRVAGVSGFQSGLAGTPITWSGGRIEYYTDQGDLSPLLPQADANALVADAFSRWTSVATAAVTATRAGSLDENVSGSNFLRAGEVLTMPADIQPTAAKPVAIVYDADGRVLDALLGAGAGASALCATNAVVGGPDRITDDAHYAHALLILNGNCAQTSADLPVLRYKLVRMLGRVLGLDWSQLNDNVVAGTPAPTLDDYAGLPLMHPAGPACSYGYGCILNADQAKMDDRAALSRLYPVTAANLASFPGKNVFTDTTARIRGALRFPAWQGFPGQGMQGVNVVARLVDPATLRASRSMAASSVSGFLFRGNAGNPLTGFVASNGERFDRFGSDDPGLEGFFDLTGLEIPTGSAAADYELRVEAINPQYTGSSSVGPYQSGAPAPSGVAEAVVVTVGRGEDKLQNMVMQGAAAEPQDRCEPHSFTEPAEIPGAGHWIASLSGYGDLDYYRLRARAGRSFSLEMTALDDSGAASEQKAQPVAGIWAPGAAGGAPPDIFQTYFTTAHTGMTRLAGTLTASGDFVVGIADYRGDGRPDFRYHARLLYADTVTPARATTAGGTVLSITGIGLAPGIKVRIGNTEAPLLSYSAEELMVAAPAMPDGVQSITLEDPATGATAGISNALSYGAGPQDRLLLLSGANPWVPVGAQAPNPIRVRVVGPDNTPAVAGATVLFSADSDAVALAPCGTRTCTLFSNDAGEATVAVAVKAAGASVITATLTNGAVVSATVSGTVSSAAVVAMPAKMWIARKSSAVVTLVARAVGNGLPLSGRTVNYQVMLGSGTLGTAHATTDASGDARTTLSVVNIASEVRVSACLAPDDKPCDIFYLYPVADTGLQLQKIAGDHQYVNAGQMFLPATVRVLDANTPPNLVAGMPVQFQITAFRTQDAMARALNGEVVTGNFTQGMALYAAETTLYTDGSGVAHVEPAFPASWGALTVAISARIAGGPTADFTLHTWSSRLTGAGNHFVPGAVIISISSETNPPTRSPSCTRDACSEVSRPSVPRRENKASWKEPGGVAEW